MTHQPGPIRAHPGRRLRSDRARQVADVLRRQIAQGTIATKLPAEAVLQREFSVSRNSIREALEILRREGLVDRFPGIGTVVRRPKLEHTIAATRGLAASLRGHGTVVNEVRTAGQVRPPTAVTSALGLGPDEHVCYIERLRRLDGEPISLDLTYLPLDIGTALLHADLETEDLFALIERAADDRLTTVSINLDAVTADDNSAALLGLPPGGALLVLQRITRLSDGHPACLEFVRMRGDRITLRMSAPNG
ncbi:MULTISPECIES: GntR family transcriptional regulator [unclassified Nocardia]|uniref:GntR family transcriptional regulator n=1 Tax=unclassified Nocardia TaxID=2637762 RepID=UPI0033BB768E